MTDNIKIKRALISVSDKSGLVELGKGLQELGVEIISTGGTLKKLKDSSVHAISISSFTGSPEILDGRVKTLHPKVYAGILFKRGDTAHEEQMSESDYKSIDLIIVNLYPFEKTLSKIESDDAEIIENIDIGGPTMIRAAAKNFDAVTVVVDPGDYSNLLAILKENDNETTPEFRKECAGKAFDLTAKYDTAIANYFVSGKDKQAELLPKRLPLNFIRQSSLRYGENPHQTASVYKLDRYEAATLINAEIISGKELSFNNYSDLDACLDMLLDFENPFACLLKHANPCGAATAEKLSEAYKMAYESDPLSAFGCIIGVNREVDMDTATIIHETPFVECILAPSYTGDAIALLKKKKNRRLLALPSIEKGRLKNQIVYKHLRGGLLAQSADDMKTLASSLTTVTKRKPTEKEIEDLLFAWQVVKHTKSNAIVLTKDKATVGIGMGQTSRVDSTFMAVKRAGDRSKGAVMGSDAFFPMPDGVEVALSEGVTAVIQPGGSKGDDKVIAACDKANATMVFTGVRHFKH